MIFFPWKDEFSVGSREMDAQHHMLVDIINRLYCAMDQKKEKQNLNSILDELMKYAQTHFGSEESLMDRSRYPNLLEHKARHVGFSKDVLARRAMLSDGKSVSALELVYWLKDWLSIHILREDKSYAPYLSALDSGVRQ